MTEEKRRKGLDDLTSFSNVYDDGTFNEAVNEERTQLERTEVEDESRAEKGWAMKRARPSKKVWCSGLGAN